MEMKKDANLVLVPSYMGIKGTTRKQTQIQ